MSTVVVPRRQKRARTASTDAGSSSDTTSTSAAGAARACTASTVAQVAASSVRSAFGEHDGHLGPRLEGQYQLALEAPQVYLAHGLGHDDPLGWRRAPGTARSVGSLRTNSRVRGAIPR